jgi:hypothetical protein
MRNALLILLLCGLILGSVSSKVFAEGTASPTIYAAPVTASALDDSLLPANGRDLPLTGTVANGLAPTGSQATVEAIPTPTAFQAGSVLLIAVATGRVARRLKLV